MDIKNKNKYFLNYKKTDSQKECFQKSFGPGTDKKKSKNRQSSSVQHTLNEKHIDNVKDSEKFDDFENIYSKNNRIESKNRKSQANLKSEILKSTHMQPILSSEEPAIKNQPNYENSQRRNSNQYFFLK